MIVSTITVDDHDGRIHRLFHTELSDGDRATCTIEHSEKKTVFTITASDPTALRAVFNGVCKLLAVDKKMSDV